MTSLCVFFLKEDLKASKQIMLKKNRGTFYTERSSYNQSMQTYINIHKIPCFLFKSLFALISAFETVFESRKPVLEVHRCKSSCSNESCVWLSCQTSLLCDRGLLMLTFGLALAPAIACHLFSARTSL